MLSYRSFSFLSVILLGVKLACAQPEPVKGYFRSPIDFPILLAGNFGEIRNNHFHAGLDIKTDGVEGKKMYAAAEGYVSRIRIQQGGYGKVLYINHPNGFTTVYAHLQRFSGEIAEYVEKEQYARQTFFLDLTLPEGQIKVEKGQVIALSGNTGGSGGPHLHFEIRETKSENALNPLLFGFDVKDEIAPTIKHLGIYALNGEGTVNGNASPVYLPVKGSAGKYRLSSTAPIRVSGYVGFGVDVNDFLNGTTNRCGVYSIELTIDTQKVYYHDVSCISFDESRYINSHVDYFSWHKRGEEIQRSFLQPNNKLKVYKDLKNNGIFYFNDTLMHFVKYKVTDSHGNVSSLSFEVRSQPFSCPAYLDGGLNKSGKYFRHDEYNAFENEDMMLGVPEDALYDDMFFEYKRSAGGKNTFSDWHQLANGLIPVHKPMTLSLKADRVPDSLRSKALIASQKGGGKYGSEGGDWAEGYLTAKIKYFGAYAVMVDTVPPVITPVNVTNGMTITKQTSLEFKISDNLAGIKTFNAFVGDQWILMEYDSKNNRMYHEINTNKIPAGQHELKIQLTDGRDNLSEFKSVISR